MVQYLSEDRVFYKFFSVSVFGEGVFVSGKGVPVIKRVFLYHHPNKIKIKLNLYIYIFLYLCLLCSYFACIVFLIYYYYYYIYICVFFGFCFRFILLRNLIWFVWIERTNEQTNEWMHWCFYFFCGCFFGWLCFLFVPGRGGERERKRRGERGFSCGWLITK